MGSGTVLVLPDSRANSYSVLPGVTVDCSSNQTQVLLLAGRQVDREYRGLHKQDFPA